MPPKPPSSGLTGGPVEVVILAAGASRRMNGVDKIFAPLYNIPLIVHSIKVFNDCPFVHQIVLVLPNPRLEEGRHLVAHHGLHKVSTVCSGGARRQDSVREGLKHLSSSCWVMVHDGARPMIDAGILQRGLKAAQETGAAVAAVPAKDTVKAVSRSGVVKETLPRDSVWLVQTPQVFDYHLLKEAHQQVDSYFADDGAMVENLGKSVKIFMGSYRNIKITTPEDLLIGETLIREPRIRSTSS